MEKDKELEDQYSDKSKANSEMETKVAEEKIATILLKKTKS